MRATGGNLHFYDVSAGCLGVFRDGDPAALSATYAVTPNRSSPARKTEAKAACSGSS